MNIKDLSSKMRDLKISKITVGYDPQNNPVCLADQQVMGKKGFSLLQHQCGGENHQEALDEVLSRASRAVILSGPVVVRPEPESN